jgi:hypothetical protein
VRVRVRHLVCLGAAALLVGCSAGSSPSTTSHRASPSRGLLGVLPVPAGATPWPANTNALLSRTAYVKLAYSKRYWTAEEADEARRGFVAAVQQGWDNPDGSQQSIRLVRFATPTGAIRALGAVSAGWDVQYSLLTDAAIGAVGWSSPTLDSHGNASAVWGVAVGDTMILAFESTAATPDPAAAKELLLQQYDSLKNGSRVPTPTGSAGTAAPATATPAATGSPSQGLLGVLPVPAQATPWSSNTNARLSLVSFVESAYSKRDWTAEEGEEARRGFVAAVQQGWDNPNGSVQAITLVRFATPTGALSAFEEVKSGWEGQYPHALLTDPAIGAVGWSSPTLNSGRDAEAEWGVAVGDTMIWAVEYTAATPDPAARQGAAAAAVRPPQERLLSGTRGRNLGCVAHQAGPMCRASSGARQLSRDGWNR